MINIVLIVFLLYNLLFLLLSYYCYKTYKYVKYLDKCIKALHYQPFQSSLIMNSKSEGYGDGKSEGCGDGKSEGCGGNECDGYESNRKWIKEILESIIDDINEDKDYKELIIIYMQIIKTCKSIYNKFANMH